MIVFTAAYETAEEAAGRPMLNSRIGWDTLTREAVISDVEASSENGTGPADAPLRPDTAEYWEPSEMPATWELQWDASQSIDYVGIAAHTIGSTGDISITVESTNDIPTGSPEQYWRPLASAHIPTDDKPIMFLDTIRSARAIRITLGGSPTPSPPRIAVIYAGLSLWMPEAIRGTHTPINLSRETVLERQLSQGGQFLGQNIRRRGFTGSVQFENLDADWYRTNFDQFVQAARQYPYFFAWRPGEREDEIVYAWTGEDISPSYMGFLDFIRVGWNMQTLGDE